MQIHIAERAHIKQIGIPKLTIYIFSISFCNKQEYKDFQEFAEKRNLKLNHETGMYSIMLNGIAELSAETFAGALAHGWGKHIAHLADRRKPY